MARGHRRTPPHYSAGTAGTAGTQPGPNALAGPGGGAQGGGTLRPVATQLRSTQDIIFTQPHFFRVPLSKPRGSTALSLSAPAAAAADTKTANSANVANRRREPARRKGRVQGGGSQNIVTALLHTKQERHFCPPAPFPSIVTFEVAVHLELGGGGGVTAPLADTWMRARSV